MAAPSSKRWRHEARQSFRGRRGRHLAALVRRYYEEAVAFNTAEHLTDEAVHAHADAPFNATMAKMIGVPARSADDALAAMNWLIREGGDSMIQLDDEGTPFDQT